MTHERYFIGQCLWDTSIPMNSKLTPDDFKNSYEASIYSAMLQIIADGDVIDESSLAEKTKYPLDNFIKLKEAGILSSSWKSFENNIRKAAQVRKVKQIADNVLKSSDTNPQMLASILIDAFDMIESSGNGYSILTEEQSMKNTMSDLRVRHKTPGELIGITSGIKSLDHVISGFQKRQLYVIGARPSQGKTALLLNFAKNCNCPCGILSAESAVQELNIRLLAMDTKYEAQGIARGAYGEPGLQELEKSALRLSKKPTIVTYDEPRMSIDTAIRVARQMRNTHGIEILFVDYLQTLAPSENDTKRETRDQIGNIAYSLKQLARALDIPVVVAAQLRRDAEGHRPQVRDFAESTQIEMSADTCILIHHENGNANKPPSSWLLVAKNRNGSLRDVPVHFIREHLLFTDA